MKKKIKQLFKSFTLVELIIVIAIVTILSVAAFLVVIKWIWKSRDARRIRDLWTIGRSLEIYKIEKWKVPNPDWYIYSWLVNYKLFSKVWEFWEVASSFLDNLKNVPTDPLDNNQYYVYWVNHNNKEYELAATIEWEETAFRLNNYLLASWKRAIVVWNYKKKEFNWVYMESLLFFTWWSAIMTGSWEDIWYELTSKEWIYMIENGWINLPYTVWWWNRIMDNNVLEEYNNDRSDIIEWDDIVWRKLIDWSYARSCLEYKDIWAIESWVYWINPNWNNNYWDYLDKSNVVLLVESNNQNLSTNFIDSSWWKNITKIWDISHSTSEKIYWNSSIYFDGIWDYLQLNDDEDWDFWTWNFTIDFWMKWENVSDWTVALISTRKSWNWWWWLYIANNKLIFASSDWLIEKLNTTKDLSPNIWYHVAVSRSVDTWKMYVFLDWEIVWEDDASYQINNYANDVLTIWKSWPTSMINYKWYMDNIRITKWKVLWTEKFISGLLPFKVYCDMTQDWWWWTLVSLVWLDSWKSMSSNEMWDINELVNNRDPWSNLHKFSDNLINFIKSNDWNSIWIRFLMWDNIMKKFWKSNCEWQSNSTNPDSESCDYIVWEYSENPSWSWPYSNYRLSWWLPAVNSWWCNDFKKLWLYSSEYNGQYSRFHVWSCSINSWWTVWVK